MYTKDLTFLLRLLGSAKQSGLLLVEAPDQRNGNETSWQGQFQLENGLVKACVVIDNKTGHIQSTNDDAINWLMAQGKLDWRIEEYGHTSLQPAAPSPSDNVDVNQSDIDQQLTQLWNKKRRDIFQRTIRGNTTPVDAFPTRDHRQIFALIDGRRTTEEVAQLLHKPPAFLLRLLQDLLHEGFIS